MGRQMLLLLTIFLSSLVQLLSSAVIELPHENKLTGYYQREKSPHMLIIGQTGKVVHCHRYEDKNEADRVLAALKLEDIERVTSRKMEELINFCTEEESVKHPKEEVKKVFIYPGTKWCGMGNTAANESELGKEKEADSCCREHDHCNDSIPSFSIKYNLTNYSPFTKSNCNCDRQFHLCLSKAGTEAAEIISGLYFDLLKMECFRETTCSSKETCTSTWQWKSSRSLF
nr:group 3 secretory phospholipase A2 isoform x1 [Hemiscorpius lepturus]